MASPATTETMEIRRRGRRRLIGAVAIVVLLVVFVPMLLDTEPHRGAGGPSTRIPSKENAAPLPAPSPAPAESKPAPTPAPPQAAPAQESPRTARLTPEPSKAAPKPAQKTAPAKAAPAAEPGPAQALAVPAQAAPRLEGFAVQVGAFHDEETLRQARAKIALAGVPYYTERIGGGLTRLRAGPFPTREAAEKARASLGQGSLEGQVVPLP